MRPIDSDLYTLLFNLWIAAQQISLPIEGNAAAFLEALKALNAYEHAQGEVKGPHHG